MPTTVVGSLTDFGLAPLAAFAPRVVFTPSRPAVGISGTSVLATKPIVGVVNPDGGFSVDLEPNENYVPDTWLTMRIEWLDPNYFGPDKGSTGVDYPQWKIRVPDSEAITFLPSLITEPITIAQIWYATNNDEPAGSKPGDLLWNTVTDDIFIIS